MSNQNNKINNYSIADDLINLIIFLAVAIIIGYLINNLVYSILIFLSIFIIYILYSNYIFERWVLNYKNNKSIKYYVKQLFYFQFSIKALKSLLQLS